MSTKSSLAHGDGFHFYNEALDDEHVYLELNKAEFEASQDHVMVRIPLEVWITIQQVKPPRLDVAGKSDQELLELVQADVDERITRYQVATTDRGRGFASLIGAWVYGQADQPRDEQIKQGLKYHREVRQRQERILERSRTHWLVAHATRENLISDTADAKTTTETSREASRKTKAKKTAKRKERQ
jgi:hypothetical protein